jgi:hypothetical protein
MGYAVSLGLSTSVLVARRKAPQQAAVISFTFTAWGMGPRHTETMIREDFVRIVLAGHCALPMPTEQSEDVLRGRYAPRPFDALQTLKLGAPNTFVFT